MKRFDRVLLVGMTVAIVMIGVENGFSVVNNPMTENLDGGGYNIFGIGDIITKGPYVDVRAYASINAAVTAIGATQTTLLVPNAQTLTASLTIPATLTLKIIKGGSIVKASTYSLTINGPFEAGLYKVFSGFDTGITFGDGAVAEQYLEWYGGAGDNSTNNTPAWTSAIGAQTNPIIKLVNGTYLGIVNTGTKDTTITGTMGSSTTAAGSSIMKNNSASSPLITVGASSTTRITQLTLDNNIVPANTITATGSIYLYLDELHIRNHGNQTVSGKWGVLIDSCTMMRIGRILFGRTNYGANASYGGHLKINTTNYVEIGYLGGGSSGTDSTGVSYFFNGISTGVVGIIEQDAIGGGEVLSLSGCYSLTIHLITVEIHDDVASSAESLIRIASSTNVKISSIHANYASASGTIKPLVGLLSNLTLVIDGFEFARTLNNGTVPIVKILDGSNKSIVIRNVYAKNQNATGTTGVAYTFFDMNAFGATSLLLENFYQESGAATHNLSGINRVNTLNVEGTQLLPRKAIVTNPGTYPFSASDISILGANSLFQDLQIYAVSGTLSGATGTITFDYIPANVQIHGVVMRVDTAVTGATSWDVAFSGGATNSISTGAALAKNTKVYKMYGTLPVTTGTTNITLTANGGNFTGGVISAVVSYRDVKTITDAP